MPDSEPPSFTTPQEEATYYRVLSKDLQDELEDLKLALADFQSSSKELEDEMEKELANTERRETELRHEAERLRGDVDAWKSRHQDTLKEHSKTMQHMQQELERLRNSEKALRGKLRDIELDNDDLEKSERAISSTLSDVESRYNKAIERTALLEQELVDKARLEEELQRTKDELRDNLEEVAVMKSARDEAVANAASTTARIHELEAQVSQLRADALENASHKSPTTPLRSVGEHDTTRRLSTMPSPDIDSADEGTPTHSAANHAAVTLSPLSGTSESLHSSTSPAPPVRSKGITRSDTVQNLASISLRQTYSPATAREKRSEGIINDMRGLTLRMQSMSKSLNTRRESLMAGSAIPRPTPRKSAVVTSTRERETVPFPRSSSSSSVVGRSPAYGHASQRSTQLSPSDSFKSPIYARPSSRLGGSKRVTPSLDSDRSALRASRPASRLSYGTGIPRPETPSSLSRPTTPSHPPGGATANRAFRRVSLGPASSKRLSKLADETVPPVPITPTTASTTNAISKRNSLANSVRKPTTTSAQPVWR